MKRMILFFIIIFISISFASAVTFPNYNTQNKYVTDTVNVIDAEWESEITNLAAAIEHNTTAQIAIVTINSTEGMPIEQYSIELAEKWGIGKSDVDNGLLILIAVEDREYRIEVGYGLEGVLNDAKVGRLGREFFVENFQAGNYGAGIYLAVQAIGQELAGEESIISQIDDSQTSDAMDYMVLFFIIAIWTLPWIFRKIAKKYGKKVGDHQWMLWGITFSMLGRGRGGFGGGGFGGGSGGFGGGGFGGGGAGGRW